MKSYRELVPRLKAYKSDVSRNTLSSMKEVGDDIVMDAKAYLVLNGNIDTGALHDSIRALVSQRGWDPVNEINLTIIADADNNGTLYGEFIEYGTGIYNEHGDGRTTPWSYKDRHGEWHTTVGYPPHPFMRPAIATNLPRLRKHIQRTLRMEQ